jgi:hypothetical protein
VFKVSWTCNFASETRAYASPAQREFDFSSVIKLWEAMWAAELRSDDDDDDDEQRGGVRTDRQRVGLTDHLHLFVVLAILQQHRDPLLSYLYNFDEILLVSRAGMLRSPSRRR